MKRSTFVDNDSTQVHIRRTVLSFHQGTHARRMNGRITNDSSKKVLRRQIDKSRTRAKVGVRHYSHRSGVYSRTLTQGGIDVAPKMLEGRKIQFMYRHNEGR